MAAARIVLSMPWGGCLIYRSAQRPLHVELRPPVVSQLSTYRQQTQRQKERAGQLFGEISAAGVVVTEATGPRKTDRSGRTWYEIERAAAQEEIDWAFCRGLHFLGDWHTHVERAPRPSLRDLQSMTMLFTTSHHSLEAIVMLIVGTSRDASTWSCSLHSRDEHLALPIAAACDPRRVSESGRRA
jgi:integrative and conjugative element protein (TIGR02256 family)